MTVTEKKKLFVDNLDSQKTNPPTTTLATPAALSLHNNFLVSITSLKRSLIRSIHYLRVIYDRKIFRLLGYTTITDYASTTAGLSRNQTEAFLALGKKLEHYPEVKKALGQGELSWSKARIIVAKADSTDEKEWIELARKVSTADLGKMVGGNESQSIEPRQIKNRVPQSQPKDPGPGRGFPSVAPAPHPSRPATEICYVTFKFTPEEYSRWQLLMESLRKQGRRSTKEQLVLEGLVGSGTSGGHVSHDPGYLLHIHMCPQCKSEVLRNSRGSFDIEPALMKAAACDAVIERGDGSRRSNIPPRLRRLVLAGDGHRCQGPGCNRTQFLEIHHRLPVAQGGRTELENLVTLCTRCHRELHRREEELRAANRDPIK